MVTLTKEKPTQVQETSFRQPEHPNGAFKNVRNLVKRFAVGEGEVTVLRDISLQIREGEFLSVVGPSGSGTSTLINMLTGIDRPSEGEIKVSGTRIGDMSEGQLSRWRGLNLGLVFQFFQLLPALSLIDNVVLPMDFVGKYGRRERRERALNLLETVGLADHASKLPGMVSGGQQQRVAIARALANDPPLLVGDEPTGNLDSAATEQMFDLFLNLVEDGKTVIMVTHNREMASRTPRVLELVDGTVARDEQLTSLIL